MLEDKRILNYQVEVHTANRVYVTEVYKKDKFTERFNKMNYEAYFWHIFDFVRKVSKFNEDVPLFIANKEIFVNTNTIEFIQLYKNVNENKTAKEGIYLINDYPYKTFYQSEKGILARIMD